MYAEFAVREAREVSPTYERLSLAISVDEKILALLEMVPAPKRQPNLLLSVVRFLGGPLDDLAAFHHFTVAHWPAVEAELRMRATQTNEAGRSALLLPVLASLPQPLALLEVGAAAGLGLYPDRYATDTAAMRSDPAVRSLTAHSPERHRQRGSPRWCGGPAWI
jgi:hypothetical protein